MPRLRPALFAAGLALAAGGGGAAPVSAQPPARSTDQPRPRDGDVAIREELDAARRAGTHAAYDLFLRRHGNHPLARIAKRERDALR